MGPHFRYRSILYLTGVKGCLVTYLEYMRGVRLSLTISGGSIFKAAPHTNGRVAQRLQITTWGVVRGFYGPTTYLPMAMMALPNFYTQMNVAIRVNALVLRVILIAFLCQL